MFTLFYFFLYFINYEEALVFPNFVPDRWVEGDSEIDISIDTTIDWALKDHQLLGC